MLIIQFWEHVDSFQMNIPLRSGRFLAQRCLRLPVSQVRAYREGENFTMDWSQVADTPEKERRQFEQFEEEIRCL